MSRVRFGYLRLTVMLKREGWAVGKKLVYRLYRNLGLQMRTKKRRKLASEQRGPVQSAVRANQRWSMDFITDRLENGRYFRTLTVVDQYTRECPVLEAAHSLTAAKVVDALDSVAAKRGYPESITVDNGSEFCSRVMDAWAYRHGVKLDCHSARQAGGERIYRELQRATARRMPQRRVVLVSRGRPR